MNIKTLALSSLIAVSATGCKQTFKEAKNVEPFVQELADTISSYSKSILQDKTYKCFGHDTLALGKDFKSNPENFVKTINDSAKSNIPTRLVDSKFVLVNTPFGREAKNHEIRKPIYTEAKAVITSPKIFEKNGEQYLPVEYWGK